MKYAVLYFCLAISTLTCAMQDANPEIWELKTRLSTELLPVTVMAEIRRAYPIDSQNGSVCINRNLYLHIKDTRVNIIKNFTGKKWFCADMLRRPQQ